MGYPTGIAFIPFIILFLDLLTFTTASDSKCGFPGTPAYGYIEPDTATYEIGDVVSYSCRVGYILLGSHISRCDADGSWTEEVPICDDSMTTLGVAFSTPTVPGHSAELAIDRDKKTCTYLKPKKPRWWRIDLGEEYRVLSVAVTMITVDHSVKFTVFIVKTQGSDASYKRCAAFTGKFGTQTIRLACADGKGIDGEKVHIEDHNQTGLFEICEVEVQVEKRSGYDCGRPSQNLYSTIFELNRDIVEYDCITGYKIRGNDFRRCLNSGQWSGEPPFCDPIICDELDPLENGKTTFSTGDSETPLKGTTAIYECDKGFRLHGNDPSRDCLEDGTWSGKPPICKEIRCPIPDGKPLGGIYRLINRTTSMGSMAILKCKRGIKKEGNNPYITCTDDAEWTKAEAHCIWPAGTSYEKKEEPRIVNQGAIIFGMVVAAIMIVVVLVALYLYTQKRRNSEKPEIPSRFVEPPAPPPRPPPREKGGTFRSAIMGLISKDSDQNAWKTQSLPSDHTLYNDLEGQSAPKRTLSYDTPTAEDQPAVIEVEVLAQDEPRKKAVSTPPGQKRSETSTPVKDRTSGASTPTRQKTSGASTPTKPKTGADYAEVNYDKKRQSRLLRDQDSVESPPSPVTSEEPDRKEESRSPTPPKRMTQKSAAKEPQSPEQGKLKRQRKRAEEEKKEKEEEEKKEAEKKAKEEEEEKKEKEPQDEAPGRRRRARAEEPAPAPVEEERPRRFRRFQ